MDSRPAQPTKNPRAHLLARTRAIVEGSAKPRRQDSISYRVSGGPATKRLEHLMEISGGGSVTIRHLDELAGTRQQTVKSSLSSERVAEVFRVLLESRLLENEDTGGGFLPDSTVGAIIIGDGIVSITYYFLADEQRRRALGIDHNPSVSRFSSVLRALSDEIRSRKK
jgi:hypothetical protein